MSALRGLASAHLDLSGQVIGQGRIGVRIAGLIAYLRTTLRMTVRHPDIPAGPPRLVAEHGRDCRIAARCGARPCRHVVEALKEQMRSSPVLHADETGWRENGQNGYAWVFATPGEQGIRYYEHDHSRGQAVVARILAPAEGQRSTACLISDFYCGYNDYAGPQQRCWVHLLRDLHELKEEHAEDDAVLHWARGVRQLYDDCPGVAA